MQNCLQIGLRAIFFLTIFFGFTPLHVLNAQIILADSEKYRAQTDSLFNLAEQLCASDSAGKMPWSWVLRSNSIIGILDDAELKEKYKNLDLHTELSKSLLQAIKLDKKKEFLNGSQNLLASNTIDLSNLAFEAMDNAKKYQSVADAEKAVELFSVCLENYKETGSSQKLVDNFWLEDAINWKWIKFYRAVSYRMAQQTNQAEIEYSALVKMGWNEPVLFLEFSDYFISGEKPDDAKKLLLKAYEKFPTDVRIACALTRLHLKMDEVKKAQKVIKPFDPLINSSTDLAMTKALVYEKRGDFKKADAIFKAVQKSDPFEVHINTEFASYLMRKAAGSEKSDAEEFAQKAYNLVALASDLSPSNENLKEELAFIKKQFPKVYREEENL